MLAVFKRDLLSYIVTMTGWVFIAFVLVFIGIYSTFYNLNYGYGNFEYVLSALTMIYLLAVPILTMRCFAEERRQGTDRLLYALPVSSGKIVLGKYLAMLVVLAVPLLVSCLYPLILSMFGDVYLPTAYAGIFAFFLLGAALSAIGMFASSLCESQVTSAVVCFALLLADYFVASLASIVPSGTSTAILTLTILIVLAVFVLVALTKNGIFSVAVGAVAEIVLIVVALVDGSALEGVVPDLLSGLSLFDRFSPFVNGIFDLTSVTFYLACIAVFVFLTVNSFEARRWN